MRGINCTELWIKALYKCSPFTIFVRSDSIAYFYKDKYIFFLIWLCTRQVLICNQTICSWMIPTDNGGNIEATVCFV